MSSGRWNKFTEDNRNYGFFPDKYDRNQCPPNNSNRYDSGRYSSNDLPQYQRLSSKDYSYPPRRYESTSDYPRRKSDYYKESNDKYRSRDGSKDVRNSSSKDKIPDKSVTNKNEENKSYEDTNKIPKDKSELNSPNTSGNKRLLSANVLSIEEAVKLSNNEKEGGEQPEKKRKLDKTQDVENKNDNAFHSHLKDIQTCKNDLVEIKNQIKSKLMILGQLKTQFNSEYDLFKELQIKKKTLNKKVKKMCRALAEVDEDKSNAEKEDIQVETLNEIILESNSDSESKSNSSKDSCSSSVQFVNETVTINNDEDESSSESSDSSESNTKNQAEISKTEYKLTSVMSDTKPRSTVTSNKSEQSIKLNKSTPNQMTETATNQIKTDTPTTNSSNKLSIKEPEAKIELVETTFKLENVNKETKLDLLLNLKTYGECSLYNEIEPKLNTIVISDEEKTFITDIKIFNNRLFVGASHGLLRQFHLGTQECIKDYKGHVALVHCILPTVYPAGINRLISGGLDKIMLIHDIDTGVVLNKIEEESSIFSMCDHLDFVYYGTVNGTVSTFSLERNRKMSSFTASKSAISCLTATKDGNNHILFVGTNDGEYCMWDAITYTKLKEFNPISHREIPIGFVLLQKQRILAFSKNYVHFINYVKTKSSTIFNHFDPMVSICLTRNYIIIGAICGKISVYKVKGSTIQKIPIRTIVNSSSPIISLTFYNNTIISGDKNGKVYFNRLVEDKSL